MCCYSLQGMVSRYPDVKLYHIVAVLAMRGDLNKNGCTKVQTSSTNKMQLCFIAHAHGKAPQNYLSINWVLDCVSFTLPRAYRVVKRRQGMQVKIITYNTHSDSLSRTTHICCSVVYVYLFLVTLCISPSGDLHRVACPLAVLRLDKPLVLNNLPYMYLL